MAILSPGIEIIEVDASAIVPTESVSVGCFAGDFPQGPVNQSIFIGGTDALISVFGEPTDANRGQWYQAYNFLQYGNMLLVGRASPSAGGNVNANARITTDANLVEDVQHFDDFLINNHETFEELSDSVNDIFNDGLTFVARTPGKWGNKIEIAIARHEDFEKGYKAFDGIGLDTLFAYVPEEYELAIAIKHEDQIESYIVSLKEGIRDGNGRSNFIETVINRESNLVYVGVNNDQDKLYTEDSDGLPVYVISEYLFENNNLIELKEGVSVSVSPSDITDTYDLLWGNKDQVDVDIVIGNEEDDGKGAVDLTEERKDCIAFLGAPKGAVVGVGSPTNGIVDWSNGFSSSSYVVLTGNYKYQYDKYSDKNIWVNLAGDIAGLRAQTNTSHAAWWASAGLERGQIKNVLKLGFIPKVADRDYLYKNGINPVTTFPGLGTVMWGQKTFQKKPSSFDRVNVRSLFNALERSLSNMSKFQVFEFNDEFTRNRINAMVRPFLETVQAGRGIQDFIFICDETNNTPDVISRNELVIDIYVKPTFVSEFIRLRFTNVGVNEFSTVISG